MTIIILPETYSMGLTQYKLPDRTGYIFGSVAMPLFDLNRRMKQGDQRLLAWPLRQYDDRFICMTDCYKFKYPSDIDNNFNNNLDIVIKMPTYHTDVFYDLGKDISIGSSFKV